MEKVSIIGLGKLGLCLGAALAYRGFEVIGVDINENVVDAINSGKSIIVEPGLQEIIGNEKYRLAATIDHREAIEKTDVTFILVATPSDTEGNFSNKYVEAALESLSRALKESGKGYHLFVISSTLMPTSTDEKLIPLIEKHSGRRLNNGFGVCYNPDLVALGSVIRDFLNPDLVIIGESDRRAGDGLEKIYDNFLEKKNVPKHRMSIINAEITKVSLNTYITMKITFANSLANISEKIAGADVDQITKALGDDKRISPYYLKGGLGFGGTCFPRDTRAFVAFGRKVGYDAVLIKAVDDVNRFQNEHLAELVFNNLEPEHNKTVSVLGLAFKPDTSVIVESPAIKLIERLLDDGLNVIAYDPLAMENAKKIFGDRVTFASSVKECLSASSFCVITTQDREFRELDESYISHNQTTILDCWRFLDPSKFGGKIKYVAIGKTNKD